MTLNFHQSSYHLPFCTGPKEVNEKGKVPPVLSLSNEQFHVAVQKLEFEKQMCPDTLDR